MRVPAIVVEYVYFKLKKKKKTEHEVLQGKEDQRKRRELSVSYILSGTAGDNIYIPLCNYIQDNTVYHRNIYNNLR